MTFTPIRRDVAPPGRTLVPTRADWIVALTIVVVAFTVFVNTMYPGLFGGGDATKFAFVGRVLGTPHAPGYPLYVLVSHLFSYLPWGSLAHRMNGMSALFGAVAAGLTYFVGRLLGLGPLASAAAGLSLAFGRSFWAKAEYAKTYTLNAAIVAAGLVALLQWGRGRRTRHLYLAIAIFALSLGNHLIVGALLPALVVYVLVTDWRAGLSWRTLLFTAAAVALSLCQYLLIIIRTRQHAPYLEAQAHDLRELVGVITVRRWAQEIGAYSGSDLLSVRVPIVAGLVSREMTIAGLVLVAAGLCVLAVRRWREALLCAMGAAGVLVLTANMSSNEDEGFLLPAFLLLWLIAAAAFDAIVRLLLEQRRGAPSMRTLAGTCAVVAAAAMPLALLASNYRVNDHHDRTYETRYFDAVFAMLPSRSAIVNDRYTVNMMLEYKLIGEDAARGRQIDIILPTHTAVDNHLAGGYQIFAFSEGEAALRNFGYDFEPVRLKGETFGAYVWTVPRGSLIAFAGTPDTAPFIRSMDDAWRRAGIDPGTFTAASRSNAIAVIGISGASGGIAVTGPLQADAAVGGNEIVGRTGTRARLGVEVSADRTTARIAVGGTELGRMDRGAVLAIVPPTGEPVAYALDPGDGLRVPIDMAPLPLYRMTAASTCEDIGNLGWRDVSALLTDGTASLQIDNYRAFDSTTVFYVAADSPAQPEVTEVSGAGEPRIAVRSFRHPVPGDASALASATAADGLQLPAAFATATVVSRVEFTVNDRGAQKAVRIGFGVRPSAVMVRSTVDLNNPKRAIVCGRRPLPR